VIDPIEKPLRETKQMVLAIVRKELRETRIFAALALGFYVIYLCRLTGKWEWGQMLSALLDWIPGLGEELPDVPFVEDNFPAMLFFIGAALAITLGFRQSAWEPSQGTALYLLHRPLARRTIFLTKLATGMCVVLGCTLLPILVHAWWAAMPGTHPGPFDWSMTGGAFAAWLLTALVYLGAFASGIRPGRWYGSRLLPLVSVACTGTLVALAAPWWLIALPLLLLAAAVYVSDILWETETRDF
jgi:ABC-type transport system involved in multi-copper enzyme maturation permease subunit